MQNNNHNQHIESTSPSSTDIDSVDKIREILFGNQMQDFERKFNHLANQLNKEINNLRDDSKIRADLLESFVKAEFESLNQRLDSEQKIRKSELEESSDKLEKHIKLLDHKFTEQEKLNNDKARELRQLLLDQAREMLEKMNQKQNEDKEMLHRVREELDNGKVDRSALSSLFTELAMQVSGNDLSTDLLNKHKS